MLAISVLEAQDEALAAGADAFLQKPFDPLELVSTVKDLLGIQRAGRSPRAGKSLVDERLRCGDEGLDLVGGGLPMNGINLIIGAPGSGKTILAQQFVFAGEARLRSTSRFNAGHSRRSSATSRLLSFFDRDAIGRSVYYEDLGGVVGE